MRDQANPPASAASAGRVLAPNALESVIRAIADALASVGPPHPSTAGSTGVKPLLDLEETAELLGVSRMTIARMADEGRLPSVIVRRGRVQKTRRIPRAFVDKLVADASAGVQVDMEEYAATWLTEHAPMLAADEPGFPP
jgi:excisionase family DNA binding protein